MTPLKVIAAAFAGLLLLPVLVISAVAGGFGDSSGSVPSVEVGDHGDLIQAVLHDPAIALTPAARSDVISGAIDPRVLEVLLLVAQTHELAPVGPLITGHSYYVKGTTRVSNHVFGRAVDILGIDGAPVSPANEAAREVMQQILTLDPPLRPDELGGPFPFQDPAVRTFTEGHQDHIHIGWDFGNKR